VIGLRKARLTTDKNIALRCFCVGVVLAATLALALSCAGTSSVRFGDQVDVSGYPADIQAAYQVFSVRCSRCHTLARPLNARIRDPGHWVRYVTRMRRNPSSGINLKDADIILKFLLYYTQRVVEEEQGERGVTEPPSAPADPPAAPPPSASEPVNPNAQKTP
jgi:hypothetical protein